MTAQPFHGTTSPPTAEQIMRRALEQMAETGCETGYDEVPGVVDAAVDEDGRPTVDHPCRACWATEALADAAGAAPDVEPYMTGARAVEMLRQSEDLDLDGPGLAAHQLAAILGIDDAEALLILRGLADEGYATGFLTKGGTWYWRYTEPATSPDTEATP